MSQRRIAYVMEQTLGNVTHYLNLRREESAAERTELTWLPIEYQATRVPWAVAGSLRARRAISAVSGRVDGLFVHTTTIALLAVDLFGRKPIVLSSDGTPLNKGDMRSAYGLQPEGHVAARAKRAIYREVFKRAAGFVAWSNWTKASFVEDYGCRDEDVAVIPPGVDLSQFAPGDRAHSLPRILFVGGAIERKGGLLLLDVFRKRLRGRAELVLVTKDPVPAEPGVEVHRDVSANSDKLRALYAGCDIFALPTRADCYPLVCMEALAAGLPLVVASVGGIPDMVHAGETGYLVKPDDAAALGDALETLVSYPDRRAAMGRACREDAGRRFEARTNARRLFDWVHTRCASGARA